MDKVDVVLLSPVSPFGPLDGHRLAVLSDVQSVLDNHLSLGVLSFVYGRETDEVEPLCFNQKIPAQAGGAAPRLIRGLLKKLPPSAERLYSREAEKVIRTSLHRWSPRLVIIDDASVGGYISLIRDTLPQAKVVLRSHNVMHDVRQEQRNRTRGLLSPLVRLDCERYQAFEREVVHASDFHWAISGADADRMQQLYGRSTSCLPVSIPLDKYQIAYHDGGRKNGFVHVGTLDFRRRSDLSAFLQHRWPKILQIDPEATLTLAGKLNGNAIPARNVVYSGRVASDAEAYRKGRFAVNFQSSTGGVKLKTLTSLAAGRALLSTVEGVEGLPLESGTHYWDVDCFLGHPNLKAMMADVRMTQPVADAGRQYVSDKHSRDAVAREFCRLYELVG